MAFRRGFKSQCERRAAEYRKQLGLSPSSPMSAIDLADHLDVTVWSVAEVKGLTKSCKSRLLNKNDDSWSALTLLKDTKHLIVYKPVISEGRKNSVIMHELAHIALGHELAAPCILEDGSLVSGYFDQDQEDEADWLAGTLLLPRPALIRIKTRIKSEETAKKLYKVSKDMLTWRLRMTGIEYQLSHRKL